MGNNSVQNRISAFAVILPVAVSLFLTAGINIDPVNLPKMVLLVSGSGYLFGLILSLKFKTILANKVVTFSTLLFIFGITFSTFASKSPFTQLLFGSNGRNTGVLTYIALTILFLGIFSINKFHYLEKLILGLFFAGIFNVVYGFLQINNLDPVDWNNTYNAIIGTFGNPNFSSAFISISLITYPYLFSKYKTLPARLSFVILICASFFAVIRTKSQQGYFLPIFGVCIILLIYIFKKHNKPWGIVSIIVFISGVTISLLGILQKGPLGSLLYQPSISLRGFYWDAGINMFKKSILVGNGFDSYGDLYLRNRSAGSILPPGGQNVVSNAAHNVFIDMAASGGLLAIVPYLLIISYGIFVAVKAINKIGFNLLYTTIVASWIGFLLQSIISINQIGLAVWVWSLTGAVISGALIILNKPNQEDSSKFQKKKPAKQETTAGAFLAGFVSAAIFFALVIPEQIADMNFKSAMAKKDIEKIQKIINSYPMSSERLSRTSQIFLRNSLNSEALDISLTAVKFNPDNLNSWITLISNPNASREQRILAKKNLVRLDPRSTEWKKIVIK